MNKKSRQELRTNRSNYRSLQVITWPTLQVSLARKNLPTIFLSLALVGCSYLCKQKISYLRWSTATCNLTIGKLTSTIKGRFRQTIQDTFQIESRTLLVNYWNVLLWLLPNNWNFDPFQVSLFFHTQLVKPRTLTHFCKPGSQKIAAIILLYKQYINQAFKERKMSSMLIQHFKMTVSYGKNDMKTFSRMQASQFTQKF